MTTTYRVTHRTEYAYQSPVSSSYGQLHLLPRELPRQRCRRAEVRVTPAPELYRERLDFFGNRVGYFALHEPHTQLAVTANSVVEVDEPQHEFSLFGEQNWERVRDAPKHHRSGLPADLEQYVLDSPRIPVDDVYRDYAAPALPAGAGIFEAVAALSGQIHADFNYAPGSTSVMTPLAEVFTQRRGVCQDLAHLMIACLRSFGLPARYVSGYLETDPPPGRPKLTGADGSHAWVAFHAPNAGWVEIDPTNDQFVNSRYVVTAFGRDYGDVPPMNGVIYTEGRTERLEVKVDVVPLAS